MYLVLVSLLWNDWWQDSWLFGLHLNSWWSRLTLRTISSSTGQGDVMIPVKPLNCVTLKVKVNQPQNNMDLNKCVLHFWFGDLASTRDKLSRGPRLIHTHDDVIKWKHFPRYWPFVRGIQIPAQRPVTRSFDVFFDQPLSKQSWGWWFETPSSTLWRHCNTDRNIHTDTHEDADNDNTRRQKMTIDKIYWHILCGPMS